MYVVPHTRVEEDYSAYIFFFSLLSLLFFLFFLYISLFRRARLSVHFLLKNLRNNEIIAAAAAASAAPSLFSLCQSNPTFSMQGGFVPVGYDLYGQAQTPFIPGGMEGLQPGAPPHQLVPYMGPHLSGGGAGGNHK